MELKSAKKRVLVAGQTFQPLTGIRDVLGREPDLFLCSEVPATSTIAAAINLESPHLLLLGADCHNPECFALTNALKLEFPHLPILVFSEGDETLYAERLLQAGARGYIMAQEPADELLSAIRTILNGKVYLSHSMSVRVVQRVLKPGSCRAENDAT